MVYFFEIQILNGGLSYIRYNLSCEIFYSCGESLRDRNPDFRLHFFRPNYLFDHVTLKGNVC
jgi:hypothetical protein